jgi:hypothetical protein
MDRRLNAGSPVPPPVGRARVALTGRGHARLRIAMVVVVIGLHLWVMREIAQGMIDFGAEAAMPPRMEVTFARDMDISAPPEVAAPLAAPVPVPAAPLAPAPVEPAASSPKKPKPAPEPPQDAASAVAVAAVEPLPAAVPEPVAAPLAVEPPTPKVLADLSTSAAPSPVAPAASAEPFAWPASTRITYELTGNYRGEVHGDAKVDWVRQGARYQVHLDVTIGPSFAPVYSRRMSSEGRLTEAGLYPERYDEDSKVAFRDHRRTRMSFEPDEVVLNNGHRVERMPGVQDSASQFVQMSYLFSRQPALLQPGRTVEIALGLPRRQSLWIYDVREAETIYTPFGELDAVRLQPRREARKGDDLTAEVWFAPSLRYLPVRIRIRQDEDTYLDLMIARKPQLAN